MAQCNRPESKALDRATIATADGFCRHGFLKSLGYPPREVHQQHGQHDAEAEEGFHGRSGIHWRGKRMRPWWSVSIALFRASRMRRLAAAVLLSARLAAMSPRDGEQQRCHWKSRMKARACCS